MNSTSRQKSEYKGRINLMITYQWITKDFSCGDSIILDKEYDTIDEAYRDMDSIMPNNYDWDDGYDFDEWNDIMEHNTDDVFVQYAYNPDSEHCMLAVFRPA